MIKTVDEMVADALLAGKPIKKMRALFLPRDIPELPQDGPTVLFGVPDEADHWTDAEWDEFYMFVGEQYGVEYQARMAENWRSLHDAEEAERSRDRSEV